MIAITGAAGFIGFRTVLELEKQNQKVISVDDPALFEKRPEHAGAKFEFKLSARAFLQSPLWAEGVIKGVIHLGACTDTTETNWELLKAVNLDYSKALWNQCAKYKVALVYASSAATYGAGENGYSDDEAQILKLKPLNLYGQSKQDFDLWVISQEKEGNTPPAWSGFKFFNVYGFGERHKQRMASVVLQAFDQIQTQGKVHLFKSHKEGVADGEQKRDFVYVADVIDVLLFALRKPIPRGIYNLGSGSARSFLDLTRATFQALGKDPVIEFIETPVDIRDKYQYFTVADLGKLRQAGYARVMTKLEVGVAETVWDLQRS